MRSHGEVHARKKIMSCLFHRELYDQNKDESSVKMHIKKKIHYYSIHYTIVSPKLRPKKLIMCLVSKLKKLHAQCGKSFLFFIFTPIKSNMRKTKHTNFKS